MICTKNISLITVPINVTPLKNFPQPMSSCCYHFFSSVHWETTDNKETEFRSKYDIFATCRKM
jgi:hypothetical protein